MKIIMRFGPLNLDRRRDWLESAHLRSEIIQPQRALRQILSFTGKSIDDVVNDPIAKRLVFGYYKLGAWVGREIEISDLERQWNRTQ